MKYLVLSALSCSLLLPVIFQTSIARSYDPCSQQTGRDRLRCEARFGHQQENADTSRIDRARQATETSSRVLLRRAERARRTQENERLLERRRTLKSVAGESNINTRRLDYLQTFRQKEYACMIGPAGRARSRCLDAARQQLREATQAQRGLRTYGAE